MASAIKGLPWVVDEIQEHEQDAVQSLVHLATFFESIFGVLMDKPWVDDGLDEFESAVIEDLHGLADEDQAIALRILDMPFLASVEPADVSVLDSLVGMVRHYPLVLEHVLAHPVLVDGITDAHTHVIITLRNRTVDSHLVDKLLDPDRTTVEVRTINLPIAGETQLAIIHHGGQGTQPMDLLEHIVRFLEDIVGAPFPTKHITILFNTEGIGGYGGGEHRETHMLISADLYTATVSDDSNALINILAHETAHYYWFYWFGDGDEWIHEGVATTLEILYQNTRIGAPLAPQHELPCGSGTVSNISELEALSDELREENWLCHYAFSERLFLDLYAHLGRESFKQGLARLYERSQERDTALGIGDITAVFGGDADEATSEIIAYWYSGAALPK